MARTWRSEMIGPYKVAKKLLLHEERFKTWKEGDYGKLWTSKKWSDPGDVPLPSDR